MGEGRSLVIAMKHVAGNKSKIHPDAVEPLLLFRGRVFYKRIP